jgi:hypothetical protein
MGPEPRAIDTPARRSALPPQAINESMRLDPNASYLARGAAKDTSAAGVPTPLFRSREYAGFSRAAPPRCAWSGVAIERGCRPLKSAPDANDMERSA